MAGILAIAVNVGFALLGLIGVTLSALIAYGQESPDDGDNATAIGFLIASVVVLVLAASGIVLARMVLRRRSVARWITVTLFSVYGLISGVLLVGGGLDPTVGAGSALVTGGIPLTFCVAIVALLLTPRAFDDFAAHADDE